MATLSQNINQAISDFNDIKTAIIAKGVSVPAGTPTSDYNDLIGDIPAGSGGVTFTPDLTISNGEITNGEITASQKVTLVIPDGVNKIAQGPIITVAPYRKQTIKGYYTEIQFPGTSGEIGSCAFRYNSNLEKVVIPANWQPMDESFSYCMNLKEVIDNNDYGYAGNIFAGCYGLKKATIVTTRKENYFAHCVSLNEVIITGQPTKIGLYAFAYCASLSTFNVPSSVTEIGNVAFNGCSSLHTINIPALTTLGNSVFNGCSALENVTIASGFNANGLNLSASTLYTAQTIVGWLNALADRTGNTAYTLTIGAANIAKLSSAEIAIATNKNWNLA